MPPPFIIQTMGLLRSMTGYGRGSHQEGPILVEVEVRSVNHRFLEANLRLPRSLMALEASIRRTLKETCHRGKLDLFLTVTLLEGSSKRVEVDIPLAQSLWKAMEEVARGVGRKDELQLALLLSRQEIFSVVEDEEDLETLGKGVEMALKEALARLMEHRAQEGEKLKKDMLQRLATMSRLVGDIRARATNLPQLYREKLQKRLEELPVDLPPERLAQEVAIMAEKMDVTEEIVRLECHLEAFTSIMEEGSPCGKKLDFLAQEILRETNTIASKVQDSQVAHLVVELKGEIEKVREQVQNIE